MRARRMTTLGLLAALTITAGYSAAQEDQAAGMSFFITSAGGRATALI